MNLDRLKKIRREKGITQKEMADELGYKGRSGYCQLENGNVEMKLSQAQKIADILNVSVDFLFYT